MPPIARSFAITMLVLIFSGTSPTPAGADDIQFWHWNTMDLYSGDPWRAWLYTDHRLGNGASDLYLQIVSLRARYRAHDHLDLALGYSWLDIDPLAERTDDFSQHRAEFELNPRLRTGPWSFQSRNRLELRWNDGEGRRLPRLRNRLQARYRFLKENSFLRSLYANNEFFFDLSNGRFAENRATPFGIGFNLSDHLVLNAFYMIQSRNVLVNSEWTHAHVAGTYLQVKF